MKQRSINWISAVAPESLERLVELQSRMAAYYSGGNSNYYYDIDFTADSWCSDPAYLRLRELFQNSKKPLEIGCGSANILRYEKNHQCKYSGCDFSPFLLERNRASYPQACFEQIQSAITIPFPDASFDFVFSTYVIEHVVLPHIFLDECHRVLRPGGVLALKCPDFLAKGNMSSQAAGLSDGNGTDKLKNGKLIDALLTGIDRKILIPAASQSCLRSIGAGFQFYININPVCFYYPFKPDYDAVYLTYRPEIESYMKGRISFKLNDRNLSGRDIFMEGEKLSTLPFGIDSSS